MQDNKPLANLEIDGIPAKITSIYAIRWVDCIDGSSYPVLYKNGKRVVKSWKINFDFAFPPDEFGGNANTD